MSTVMKSPLANHRTPRPRTDDELRRDRWILIAVLTVMIAAIGLVLWLASMAGVPVDPIESWPIMP